MPFHLLGCYKIAWEEGVFPEEEIIRRILSSYSYEILKGKAIICFVFLVLQVLF